MKSLLTVFKDFLYCDFNICMTIIIARIAIYCLTVAYCILKSIRYDILRYHGQ